MIKLHEHNEKKTHQGSEFFFQFYCNVILTAIIVVLVNVIAYMIAYFNVLLTSR